MRDYRIIYGKSYPSLFSGANQPNNVTSDLSDPMSFYYDDALKLTDSDVEEFVGKPLCYEHDKNNEVGEISAAWKDSDGHMRITGRIFVDTDSGKQLWHEIEHGARKGLSVGYNVPLMCVGNNLSRKGKLINEISIVSESFFEEAQISITANKNYKTTEGKNNLLITLEMSSEQQQPEEKKPETPVNANKEGSELAKHHNEVLLKNEELRKQAELTEKRNKEMEARLKMFEDMENRRKEEYKNQQKPIADEVVAIQEEQWKETHGEDAKLSETLVEGMRETIMDEGAKEATALIVASARSWKKARDEQKKLEASLKEEREKTKKFAEEEDLKMAQIDASRRLHLATSNTESNIKDEKMDQQQKMVSVNASKSGLGRLFVPQPSKEERMLYQMSYGEELNVDINASANQEQHSVPPVREHAYLEHCQHGARFHPNGKFMFSHLMNNDFSKVRVQIQNPNLNSIDY